MKIKIRAENKGKFTEIPVEISECKSIHDALFLPDGNFHRNLEANKIAREVYSFHNKIIYLMNDIIHGGKTYEQQNPVHHIEINGRKVKVKEKEWKFVQAKRKHKTK